MPQEDGYTRKELTAIKLPPLPRHCGELRRFVKNVLDVLCPLEIHPSGTFFMRWFELCCYVDAAIENALIDFLQSNLAGIAQADALSYTKLKSHKDNTKELDGHVNYFYRK